LTATAIYHIVSLCLCAAFMLGISRFLRHHFTDGLSSSNWQKRNCFDCLDLQFVHRRSSTGFYCCKFNI